ncbi:MAG TPA: fibronectin type III domain-containing protein [Planctomycetota bacterium]|nr:fibronectin type III domain-containing protein [Planctomycetota bacterium]
MNRTMNKWTRGALALLLCGLVPACTGSNSNGTPPTFTSNIAATSTVSSQAVVTWSPAVDYSGTGITYNLAWSLTSGGESFTDPTMSMVGISTTTATVTPLTPSDTYYFMVQAVDGNGVTDANSPETETAVTIHP